MNGETYRSLVSGGRRGLAATLLRGVMRAAEFPYSLGVHLRNVAYDRHLRHVHQAPVPVVSVGNLTLGGTGKTPMVAWLARWFAERGVRVVLVSRGYGARAGEMNDEARELAWQLPDVPHLQNPDRVAAVEAAVEEHGAELIVLDDGFQHRRLARDLDIVLIDALEPFGFGHLFPRGMLREPIGSLARADLVGVTRSDMVDRTTVKAIRDRVARLAPQAACCQLAHAPRRLINARAAEATVDSLAGRRVAAFCGIGNPSAFRHTLDACRYQVVALRDYADHHRFGSKDVAELDRWAAETGADAIVCTGKDLVKIGRSELGGRPLWALTIELTILDGQDDVTGRLERLRASL